MSLLPCPACGREVSRAAAACPQCGQPIAGVVVPPPAPPRGAAFNVDALKIDSAMRADRTRTPTWVQASIVLVLTAIVATCEHRASQQAAKQNDPKAPLSARDAQRAKAAQVIGDALRPSGVEYVSWQGNTLLVVTGRVAGDMQAVADATCNALRRQGVTGSASVAVLERNAFLNGRREYLGEARCSLPR